MEELSIAVYAFLCTMDSQSSASRLHWCEDSSAMTFKLTRIRTNLPLPTLALYVVSGSLLVEILQKMESSFVVFLKILIDWLVCGRLSVGEVLLYFDSLR